ncbi:hypothetical protein Anapl_04526 [Anas platyrhynchos]|uniref:Uncharacterized protein n=1 Tax=Anas platyrhynchos TaxID=8839 RepID=R0LUU7_ANAPL|nr:hypothetical protein Anapl_04526 [Anas platyrhynchos]
MAKSANVRKHATEEVALVVWFPSCHSGNCILPSHTDLSIIADTGKAPSDCHKDQPELADRFPPWGQESVLGQPPELIFLGAQSDAAGSHYVQGSGVYFRAALFATVILQFVQMEQSKPLKQKSWESACEEGMEMESTMLLALTKCLHWVEALPPVQAINCKGLALFSRLIHC